MVLFFKSCMYVSLFPSSHPSSSVCLTSLRGERGRVVGLGVHLCARGERRGAAVTVMPKKLGISSLYWRHEEGK